MITDRFSPLNTHRPSSPTYGTISAPAIEYKKSLWVNSCAAFFVHVGTGVVFGASASCVLFAAFLAVDPSVLDVGSGSGSEAGDDTTIVESVGYVVASVVGGVVGGSIGSICFSCKKK